MRTISSRCLSVPILLARTFRHPSLFSSTRTPYQGLEVPSLLRIRPSQHCLSWSTLSVSASSSSPIAFREAEESGSGHKAGFIDLLKSENLNKCDEEEDYEKDCFGSEGRHIPVLLSEIVAAFQHVQLHTFVDCTLGAAGHASSIIMAHPELKRFVGLDVDPVAHSEALTRLQAAVEHRTKACTKASILKLDVLKANFRNIKTSLQQVGLECGEIDGVLLDLGMSSMQLNVAERGFSLQLDGPLDMRMDPMLSTTASDILNDWPETEIGKILREFGEEKHWKLIAKKISEAQRSGGIHSTSDLLTIIQKSLPLRFTQGRAGLRKTAVRVFQGLRIAVNDELSSLRVALPNAFECLRPGGCLAVVSFHSLEDRIVKQFFLEALGDPVLSNSKPTESKLSPSISMSGNEIWAGELRTRLPKVLEGTHASILTKRPLTPDSDEVRLNPRARSAKLRLLVKK